VGSTKREAGLPQHRSIDVGDATLECTLRGSGAPVVLLANAGCSTGYFDQLARTLVTGGFQTISINMRGVGGSRGSLEGATKSLCELDMNQRCRTGPDHRNDFVLPFIKQAIA